MHIGIQRDRKIDIDMCVCVFVHELVLLHMYACICLFIHLGHDLLINVFVDSFIYWSIYVLCVYLFTVTFSFYVHYCRLSCAGTCRSRKSTSQGSLALDSKAQLLRLLHHAKVKREPRDFGEDPALMLCCRHFSHAASRKGMFWAPSLV